MSFGINLKKTRLAKQFSQEMLAQKINTSRSNIANYETEKNMPSLEILSNISEVLDVSTDYLLEKTLYKNFKEYEEESKELIDILGKLPEDLKSIITNFALNMAKSYTNKEIFNLELQKQISSIQKEGQRAAILFSRRLFDETLHKVYLDANKLKNNVFLDLDDLYLHSENKDIDCVPLLNNFDFSAHHNIFSTNNIIDYIPFTCNYVDIKNCFAYKLLDDSTLPPLGAGDIIILEKCDTYEDDMIYLCSLDNADILIKKIKEFNDYIELHTPFSYTQPIKLTTNEINKRNFKILGKVIKAEIESAFK